MKQAEVHTVPMGAPDDVSNVRALFKSGAVDPAHVIAIIAQTEGDGYARGFAAQSMQLLLGEYLKISNQEVFDRIPMMMIGGTAGIMCPHYTLFVNKPAPNVTPSKEKRLVLGSASTRALLPEEYGRIAQVNLVTAAVEKAMAEAGITDPNDVVCVELKVPQMTGARMKEAASRGKAVVNDNALVASGMSRGASALGAAIALGEIPASAVRDEFIGRSTDIYSERASASSGGEQVGCRVVVIGNLAGSPSSLIAGRGVMNDQLDLDGAYAAFHMAGLHIDKGKLTDESRKKFVTAFANAGANYVPDVKGRRHTMLSDLMSAWAGHQAKAVVHAVISSIVGDTLHLANAGAEHQGRPGANLVCVVAKA
jgi:cyanuric acid amidohydrolase